MGHLSIGGEFFLSKKFRSLEELRHEIEKLKLEGEDLQHLRDKCEEFKLMRKFKKQFRKWEFD